MRSTPLLLALGLSAFFASPAAAEPPLAMCIASFRMGMDICSSRLQGMSERGEVFLRRPTSMAGRGVIHLRGEKPSSLHADVEPCMAKIPSRYPSVAQLVHAEPKCDVLTRLVNSDPPQLIYNRGAAQPWFWVGPDPSLGSVGQHDLNARHAACLQDLDRECTVPESGDCSVILRAMAPPNLSPGRLMIRKASGGCDYNEAQRGPRSEHPEFASDSRCLSHLYSKDSACPMAKASDASVVGGPCAAHMRNKITKPLDWGWGCEIVPQPQGATATPERCMQVLRLADTNCSMTTARSREIMGTACVQAFGRRPIREMAYKCDFTPTPSAGDGCFAHLFKADPTCSAAARRDQAAMGDCVGFFQNKAIEAHGGTCRIVPEPATAQDCANAWRQLDSCRKPIAEAGAWCKNHEPEVRGHLMFNRDRTCAPAPTDLAACKSVYQQRGCAAPPADFGKTCSDNAAAIMAAFDADCQPAKPAARTGPTTKEACAQAWLPSNCTATLQGWCKEHESEVRGLLDITASGFGVAASCRLKTDAPAPAPSREACAAGWIANGCEALPPRCTQDVVEALVDASKCKMKAVPVPAGFPAANAAFPATLARPTVRVRWTGLPPLCEGNVAFIQAAEEGKELWCANGDTFKGAGARLAGSGTNLSIEYASEGQLKRITTGVTVVQPTVEPFRTGTPLGQNARPTVKVNWSGDKKLCNGNEAWVAPGQPTQARQLWCKAEGDSFTAAGAVLQQVDGKLVITGHEGLRIDTGVRVTEPAPPAPPRDFVPSAPGVLDPAKLAQVFDNEHDQKVVTFHFNRLPADQKAQFTTNLDAALRDPAKKDEFKTSTLTAARAAVKQICDQRQQATPPPTATSAQQQARNIRDFGPGVFNNEGMLVNPNGAPTPRDDMRRLCEGEDLRVAAATPRVEPPNMRLGRNRVPTPEHTGGFDPSKALPTAAAAAGFGLIAAGVAFAFGMLGPVGAILLGVAVAAGAFALLMNNGGVSGSGQ